MNVKQFSDMELIRLWNYGSPVAISTDPVRDRGLSYYQRAELLRQELRSRNLISC